MTNVLIVMVIVLLVAVVVLQLLSLRRRTVIDLSPLSAVLDALKESGTRVEKSVREEIAVNRQEAGTAGVQSRDELRVTLAGFNDALRKSLVDSFHAQNQRLADFADRLDKLTTASEKKIGELKATVETKLTNIQNDNAKQLEEMRKTVDEKLQGTLEKRLGDSFKLVSERLEQVHKGLGEMQSLALGVGDLKKVLTNVKTRGTWGEVQLGNLLEQVFTAEQFARNVATVKGSRECVEFAVKFPNRDGDEPLWMPIDAKFPLEDYARLADAAERADAEALAEATRGLETRVKNCARDIAEKYLNPPDTTPFGILYLPTEGLYAEVVRRTELVESIRRLHRVEVAGPTTLLAMLTSFQMGFYTLAIQKRSNEVWNLLAAVKTEWSKYGDVLDKVQEKLKQASDTIDKAQTRTRVIGRKLKDVHELPASEAEGLFLPDAASPVEAGDES